MNIDRTTEEFGQGKVRLYSWFLSHNTIVTVLLACSVLLNIFLANRISKLNQDLVWANEQKQLTPGMVVTSLEVLDKDGKPVTISYLENSLPTVLYIFSPTCHWCEQNIDNINFLANYTGDKYRFIGISLSREKLEEYLVQHKMPFSVYHSLSDSARLSYGLGATPQTIVISSDGKVLRNWSGAYGNVLQEEIETFFKVKLPGLAALPK
jgi:peroxiredoxin